MQEQASYTLQEVYEELPCTLVELGERAGLNEVTIARVRDGKPARRSTINKLLLAFSEIYQRPFSLSNVTGIHLQFTKTLAKQR